MEEILKLISELSISERRTLIKKITEGIEKELFANYAAEFGGEDRWMRVVACAEKTWGIDNITRKTRKRECVWARAFAAHQMLKEGCPMTKVARIINRDRTSVIYLKERIDNMLYRPKTYEEEFAAYKLFQSIL